MVNSFGIHPQAMVCVNTFCWNVPFTHFSFFSIFFIFSLCFDPLFSISYSLHHSLQSSTHTFNPSINHSSLKHQYLYNPSVSINSFPLLTGETQPQAYVTLTQITFFFQSYHSFLPSVLISILSQLNCSTNCFMLKCFSSLSSFFFSLMTFIWFFSTHSVLALFCATKLFYSQIPS